MSHIVGRLKGAMKKMVAQRQLRNEPLQQFDTLQVRRNKHRVSGSAFQEEEARPSDSAL